MNRTPDASAELVAELNAANDRTDWLGAVDIAEQLLAADRDSTEFRYYRALAFARAGATRQAMNLYREDHLAERAGTEPAALRVDIRSLNARLLKDEAFLERDALARRRAFHAAALAYGAADESDPYPLVNAATLYAMSDDIETARRFARRAKEGIAQAAGFWPLASLAEAEVVLGNYAAAERALQAAADSAEHSYANSAISRRQLRRLLHHLHQGFELLAPLQRRVPTTIHFTGRRFAEGASFEERTASEIRAYIEQHAVKFGFGSLAAGADILVAEALLACDADVTVVLPYNMREFIERSVAPMGAGWVPRFERIIERLAAGSGPNRTLIHFATKADDEYLGDDILYGYAARFAMGLAILRAEGMCDGPVRQLAIWAGDERPDAPLAGTVHDIRAWQAAGKVTDTITVSSTSVSGPSAFASEREVQALIFGDFYGFSRLRESQLPAFAERVMGAVAQVLDEFGDRITFRNTWGDGLYLVVRDARSAARCALALQELMDRLPFAELGFPDRLQLRLGAHFGPIRRLIDPITGRHSFFGEHVSRTARIEPITVPGAVYVTEHFAAELALGGATDFTVEYVGNVPLAKDYMTTRIYLLRSIA